MEGFPLSWEGDAGDVAAISWRVLRRFYTSLVCLEATSKRFQTVPFAHDSVQPFRRYRLRRSSGPMQTSSGAPATRSRPFDMCKAAFDAPSSGLSVEPPSTTFGPLNSTERCEERPSPPHQHHHLLIPISPRPLDGFLPFRAHSIRIDELYELSSSP